MNIVLFTPVNAASAIGRCSWLIEQTLVASGHSVSIIQTEHETYSLTAAHPFSSPIHSWKDQAVVENLCANAEGVLYQIGNNYLFHKGSIHWAYQKPGIIILHDYFLGNLFMGWSQEHPIESPQVLKNWYGEEAYSTFVEASTKPSFCEDMVDSMPLLEWICSTALGVITHSAWNIKRVLNSCPRVVKTAPLPYNNLTTFSLPEKEDDHLNSQKELTLLTLGHANKNKRIEEIITAIGSNAILKKQCLYKLVGFIDPTTKKDIIRLAEQNNISLEILGEVTDDVLQKNIDSADVLLCLRYPALEAASASCIEALLNGKPTIVTDTGFYSELPDDIVIKINPTHEISELSQALFLLYSNPDFRHNLGKKGQVFAQNTFSPYNYAKVICETIEETNRITPIVHAIKNIAFCLQKWNSLSSQATNTYILKGLKILEPSVSDSSEQSQ